MYIRIYKNIDNSTAKELRKACKKNDFFSKSNNSDFLFDEFPKDDEYHLFDYIDKNDQDCSRFSEDLGAYSFPKYLFAKNLQGPVFGLNWDFEHKYESLSFYISFAAFKSDELEQVCKIGLTANWDERTGKNKFNFFIRNTDTARENIVYDIPLCFYNNREIYEKISSFLIKNKNEMIKASGNKCFIKDLISLFSVKRKSSLPLKPSISNSVKEKEFIIYDGKTTVGAYDKEGSREDLTTLSFFDNIHRVETEIKGIENVVLRIGKQENILAIDFIFGNSNFDFLSDFGFVGDVNVDSIKNNEKLDNFLDLYLEDWLNNYLLFSNFTSEVYGKVKSKILISSINK